MKNLIHNPNLGLLILRLTAGLGLAFAHGFAKFPPHAGIVHVIAQLGFPFPIVFAWIAGFSEFLGGLCIAAGLFTRPATLIVGFTMVIAAVSYPGAKTFATSELALLYLIICQLLFFQGAGRFSLDRIIRKVS